MADSRLHSSGQALLVAVLLGSSPLGCAVSLGATPAASLDTEAKPGGEGRIDGMVAGGDKEVRFYLAAHTGGGYLSGLGSGYGMVATDLGIEAGNDVRVSGGPIYVARFLMGEASGTRHGFGAGGVVAFRVTDRQTPRRGVFLGPRLQAEHLWGQDGESNRGLFSLGLEIRWVTMDTTGASLAF